MTRIRDDSHHSYASINSCLKRSPPLAVCARRHAMSKIRKAPRFVLQACDLMREQYSDKLSLSIIAKVLDIHPVYLATEFRKWRRCTVGEYLRRVRIEAARDQVVNSDKSFAIIAAELGFSHQAHFTRTFKEHVGRTPSEYRRELRSS